MDAAKTAAPYLNALDELLIAFILWKWFRRDLVDYRKWLAAKEVVKDRIARGELRESADPEILYWAGLVEDPL